MQDQFELKPCPFCGGKAVALICNGVRVLCTECEISTPGRSDGRNLAGEYVVNALQTVVDMWNRRADNATDE